MKCERCGLEEPEILTWMRAFGFDEAKTHYEVNGRTFCGGCVRIIVRQFKEVFGEK